MTTQKKEKPAVILLSGGLDSTTTAAIAQDQGFSLYALSFDYGQRHRFELEAAARIARALGVRRHIVFKVDLAQFGGSALTAAIDVPKDRPADAMAQGIPITYVPARNTVFLSLALAYAETLGRPISFWASTRSTIADTPTAGRNIWTPLPQWPIWRRRRAWRGG